MRSFSIKYGSGHFDLKIPPAVEIIKPPVLTLPQPDIDTVFTQALENSGLSLENCLAGGNNLVIVIPDLTRKCRLDLILPLVLKEIEKAGFNRGSIKILIACGTHKYKGLDEYRPILGSEIIDKYVIDEHDCDSGNIQLFETTRGTPVELNRRLTEADRIIAVGGTLPHYFAGFGGGPKLIMPGCAGRTTIDHNHRFSLNLTGDWIPGTLAKDLRENDLIQDIIEAVSALKKIFHVGIILGDDEQPREIFAGELFDSYYRMIQRARNLFTYSGNGKADIVIVGTGGHPKDIDLLQSHKSMYHAAAGLKIGGTMLVYARCGNGVGSDTLKRLLELETLEEVKNLLSGEYIINGQAAYSLFMMGRLFKVKMITELNDRFMENLGFSRITHDDVQELLDNISPDLKIFCFPSASAAIYNNTILNN